MPGRRSTTTTQPTPLEETEPTAPAQPAPDSSPEPAPEPAPEPEAPEQDTRSLRERIADRQAGVLSLTRDELREWAATAVTEFAANQREAYPLTVHEAIAEVTRRVDAIAKDRTASQGGSYKYRGIDDVFAALHPLLGDVGLVIMPGRIIREAWETRSTSSGGTLNVARLLVRYTLVGPDGSKLRGEAWGEGGDSGDKATQKALSQAYKSFTLQTFSIPTEDSARDEPDATNPPARPFTAEEVARARKAWDAAQEVANVEQLAGVRQRALHLLNVPIVRADGSIAPLSVRIDEQRATLEGVTG